MKSHFQMILREASMYKHVMKAVCFGVPQPRWFAISPKRSINGWTWQAANVSGLGQTQYYNMILWDGPCTPFHVVFGFRVHVHPIPGP